MAVVYNNFYGGAFFGGGFFGPGISSGGGDSTRFRRKRKGRTWRYWWETDEPTEVLVLSPEEAVQEPVAVEDLWAEKSDLGVYIEEMVSKQAGEAVVARLSEIDAFIDKQIAAEERRQRRIRKKRMLLLNG